jgi:hypothetical protein
MDAGQRQILRFRQTARHLWDDVIQMKRRRLPLR